jgi:hypothetical protein
VLDTTSLEFTEFQDLPDKPYAILSHRWGPEEVTFKEYRKMLIWIQDRAGYKKIVDFCQVAKLRGFHYAWIDTCCIDKRSSAELSEAINSMYQWYAESTECYILLQDYRPDLQGSFEACEWFGRGWTLQELLAPKHCVFFTAAWKIIGHKHFWDRQHCPCEKNKNTLKHLVCGPDLSPQLAAATQIPEHILSGSTPVHAASVALRMSWASQRSTTREEDRAYSLLGIFDINMPLLYGEGVKAFRRLQEEIIRTSKDSSIFCFGLANPSVRSNSVLAESPAQYSHSHHIIKGIFPFDEPYSITRTGLRIVTYPYKGVWRQSKGGLAAGHTFYAIPLARSSHDTGGSNDIFLIVRRALSGSKESIHAIRVDLQRSIGVNPPSFGFGRECERWSDMDWERGEQCLFYIRIY